MGCSFSDSNWQEEMENAEMAVYQSIDGLNLDMLTLSFAQIVVNGENM